MTDQSNVPTQTKPANRWARPLALTAAVVFCISAVFPVGAGLSQNTALFPKWWGILDVVVAFVLAALTIVIVALAEGKVGRQAQDASYRAYRALSHGILVLIVVFFLFGDRIVWINCLPGFAWRSWVLLYGLPAWFTALRGGAAEESDLARGPTTGLR
jgi:protein-S-isoprenylcysteine O-methyltransferase Ste14